MYFPFWVCAAWGSKSAGLLVSVCPGCALAAHHVLQIYAESLKSLCAATVSPGIPSSFQSNFPSLLVLYMCCFTVLWEHQFTLNLGGYGAVHQHCLRGKHLEKHVLLSSVTNLYCIGTSSVFCFFFKSTFHNLCMLSGLCQSVSV